MVDINQKGYEGNLPKFPFVLVEYIDTERN